jgi:hypothetical protein
MIPDIMNEVLLKVTMKYNELCVEYQDCPQHHERQAIDKLIEEMEIIIHEYTKD